MKACPRTSNPRADRESAKKFWQSLHRSDRFEIGDQLVLGDLDHHEWFGCKKSAAFLNELDRQRMLWESES